MKVHLFNPENDLALAAGTSSYTPPAAVRRFKEALAQLPRLYASEGDIVLTPGMKINDSEIVPAPWGWSRNAVAQFKKAGIDGPFPDVDKLRELSHRRTSLLLYNHLAAAGTLPYQLQSAPREIFSPSEISDTEIMLKSPWSCSGRGVTDCSAMNLDSIERIAEGIIRRQGSAMVEPKLPKNRDFALLFYCENRRVSFKGLSLFFNSATSTAYGGNLCASQAELHQELNAPYLDETIDAVMQALTEIIAPYYSGPLGVDMITYGPENLICPTIEVNLRMTMGFVALSVYEKYGRGVFRVSAGSRPDDIQLIEPNSNFSVTFQPI